MDNINDLGGFDPTWWTFGEWNRMTTWMKAGATPETDAGNFMFQGMSETGGQLTTTSTNAIFQGGTAPYEWKSINIAGWARETNTTDTPDIVDAQILYDDIYFAWGDNAAARVEIGDNSDYSSCTILSVCDAIQNKPAWTDEILTVNLRQANLNFVNPVYLFVFDKDNNLVDTREVK